MTIGRFGSPFGVQGWIKVYSYTDPPENILNYLPWQIVFAGKRDTLTPVQQQVRIKDLIVKVAGCETPEQVRAYTNVAIEIERAQLPTLAPQEHYWHDLIGLTVINRQQQCLGNVDHLVEAGSTDVLVIKDGKKEHLIPYLMGYYIDAIDLEQRCIKVDWDPAF